jgi:hypothetical protein
MAGLMFLQNLCIVDRAIVASAMPMRQGSPDDGAEFSGRETDMRCIASATENGIAK